MVKKLIFITICAFLFIPIVYAKDQLEITNVKVIDSNGAPKINQTDKIDITFNSLEQTIEYEVTLKNNTKNEIYINDYIIPTLKEDYINIKLKEKYVGDKISPKKSKKLRIVAQTEKKENAGKNFNDEINIKLILSEKMLNPNTSSDLAKIICVIIFCIMFFTIYIKFSRSRKMLHFVFLAIIISSFSNVIANDKNVKNINVRVSYESQNIIEQTNIKINNLEINYDEAQNLYKNNYKIKNIYIETLINIPKNYSDFFDLSENKNKKVLAYVVPSTDDYNDLYIMSDGIIYANQNSTGLFSFETLENIHGFSNIDFENTNSMRGMFYGDKNLKNIEEIKSINFQNVNDTSYMFYQCYNLDLEEKDLNINSIQNKENMFGNYLYNKIKNLKDNKSVYEYGTQMYHYKGKVNTNNVVFANMCWQIVRTTTNKEIKLVYNGLKDSNGHCTATGPDTALSSKSEFTPPGTKLYETKEGLNYVYTDGTSSEAKKTIDEWYKNNLNSYTNMLADVVWCNDKRDWYENTEKIFYQTYWREKENQLALSCRTEDSITVTSGKSAYPVGMLTSDEVRMTYDTQKNSYLIPESSMSYWLMSPAYFEKSGNARMYGVYYSSESEKGLFCGGAGTERYLRPAIALKAGTELIGGDGTKANPYSIKIS